MVANNFKTHFKKMFSRLFEPFRARLASKLSIKKKWKNKVFFTFITVWKKLSAFFMVILFSTAQNNEKSLLLTYLIISFCKPFPVWEAPFCQKKKKG